MMRQGMCSPTGSRNLFYVHNIDTPEDVLLYEIQWRSQLAFFFTTDDNFSMSDICTCADRQLALQDGSGAGGGARLQSQGMELSLPSSNGGSGPRRLLGNRSFAVYYRQRHPVAETRQSIVVWS
jgi:hypothetical protein